MKKYITKRDINANHTYIIAMNIKEENIHQKNNNNNTCKGWLLGIVLGENISMMKKENKPLTKYPELKT